jgi:hypothetical protein
MEMVQRLMAGDKIACPTRMSMIPPDRGGLLGRRQDRLPHKNDPQPAIYWPAASPDLQARTETSS